MPANPCRSCLREFNFTDDVRRVVVDAEEVDAVRFVVFENRFMSTADLKSLVYRQQEGHQSHMRPVGETVLFYMRAVKLIARVSVHDLLLKSAERYKGEMPLVATEYMIDGSRISLATLISRETRSCLALAARGPSRPIL